MVETWERVQIGDSFDFKNGLNKAKEFFGKGTPIVNYTDVYKKRGLYKADIKGRVTLSPDEIRRFQVEKDDVFFTRTSETPEEVGFASVLLEEIADCVFSGFILRAHPKNDKFFPPYCKYCFMTPDVREAIAKSCTYTTRALTNGRQLSAIEILLPPFSEQQRIAEALSDMDEMIASLEKLIAKKKAVKQGAMQELLTGKCRLPGFSGEWKSKAFGDLFLILPNNSFSREQLSLDGKIKNIHYGDILTKYGAYLDGSSSGIPSLGEELEKKGFPEKSFVQNGDVIIADTAEDLTVGKAVEMLNVIGKVLSGQHTFLCRPVIPFAPMYLGYYLNSADFHDQMIPFVTGTKVSSINKTALCGLTVRYPDLAEQRAIAEVLSDMDDNISILEKRLRKARQSKQGMMQQLLTGKIRL